MPTDRELLVESEALVNRLLVIGEKQNKLLQELLKRVEVLQDAIEVINMELSFDDNEDGV